jgi:hypothetical protein
MSIYATLGSIRIEPPERYARPGQDWPEVYFQSVPSHIGHPRYYPDGDPYREFLPPVVEDEDTLRAVVVVLEGHHEKDIQRYVRPLLTLTGEEWQTTPFPKVLERIKRAVYESLQR